MCVCMCVYMRVCVSLVCCFVTPTTLDAVTVVLFNLLSVFADKQVLGEAITGMDVRKSVHIFIHIHKRTVPHPLTYVRIQ